MPVVLGEGVIGVAESSIAVVFRLVSNHQTNPNKGIPSSINRTHQGNPLLSCVVVALLLTAGAASIVGLVAGGVGGAVAELGGVVTD